MADNQQSRFEKSLGLLTTRFVSLLQKAKDGVLDLKVVSTRDLARALKKLTCTRLSDRGRTRHTWVAGILKEVRGEGTARVRPAVPRLRGRFRPLPRGHRLPLGTVDAPMVLQRRNTRSHLNL